MSTPARIGRKAAPRSHIPIVREVFSLMVARRIPVKTVAVKSGVALWSVSKWRSGGETPKLSNFIALCQAAGYDLKLVRRTDAA